MASPNKVMTGARAIVKIKTSDNGAFETVGVFNNVSYGLAYDVNPAFILGRYGPAELDYTAQQPVSIQASGWRVVGSGAHKAAGVPLLQALMSFEYMQFVIVDRQTDLPILTVDQVVPTGYSGTIAARQQTEITVSFMGITISDENGYHQEPGEGGGPANLP